MLPKVYIETSFVSYLTAKPSQDAIVYGHQLITTAWWENRKDQFELFASRTVLQEASKGDANYAAKRIEILLSMPILEIDDEIRSLSDRLIGSGILPAKAKEDAIHIATAAVHRLQYLLTWNCRHLANDTIRTQMRLFFESHGYEMPLICTPDTLMVDLS